MYFARGIFQLFRADIKAEIAAQGAKPDAEEVKEAAANSANKTAKNCFFL